ncbi:transcriptional regulator [Gallibacterium salpingitidis]|uniref:Transcriptional regulator n=1 Tax=Gallibacterium salpingitidis TaxID=505341 RepID=A0AB36E3G0_9PAST|nr:helix-turn-helix transcriptional regulator [Gallibacterium salpingitidis]OBX10970.1 transcriptional regulator [Gallibacterium salpingitidis]WKS99651.1 helix-turn-helix domain-containing protein [Gallibacterium salpingitidis]
MEIYDKVRVMREVRQWSQEEMAERMGMSVTGYAKIERGQSKLHYDKLEKIAQIFNISVLDLVTVDEKKPMWYFAENCSNHNTANYYAADDALILEVEKLKATLEGLNHTLQLKNELLSQKDNEITALKEIISLLKK